MKEFKHAYYIIEYYGQTNNVFRENPLNVFFGRLVSPDPNTVQFPDDRLRGAIG